MGYPTKRMNLSALLAAVESTYGTAATLAATADGQLLALSDRYPGIMTRKDIYDGAVGPSPGNLGMLKRVGTLGRSVSGDIPMRAKGNGSTATTAAYATTALPNIDVMLRISGFTRTIGSGEATYTLTPDSNTYASASMEYYKRGEKWTSRGCIASCKFDLTGPQSPIWTFTHNGILSAAITDSAVAAPTYPNLTTQEPLGAGITLAIGSFASPVVRSASFNLNRSIDNVRTDLNQADILSGFIPGGYEPELTVVVEAEALNYPTDSTGFDPYKMLINAEENDISLLVGSAVNNRFTLSMAQCQLKSVNPNQNDGPIALTELTFACNHSSPIVQTDAVVITWD